ncbi:MAG: AbrB/MazE/SpoVT family DNA-binding domain-containing protein [Methanocellales archaeon]|nr:AbrB/MazE/SpoVT family DNA-binding domain-containing protein [Methanocellales archaeon]
MTSVKMSTKGQIVIPTEIRKKYGIKPGDELEVLDFGKEIVLTPVAKDAIKYARGLISFKRPVSEMLSEVRKEEQEFERKKLGSLRR